MREFYLVIGDWDLAEVINPEWGREVWGVREDDTKSRAHDGNLHPHENTATLRGIVFVSDWKRNWSFIIASQKDFGGVLVKSNRWSCLI